MPIEQRHRTFFAYLDVPKDVRNRIGRRIFRQTLQTDSRTVAKRRAAPLIAQWKSEIAGAREKPKRNDAEFLRDATRRAKAPDRRSTAKTDTKKDAHRDIVRTKTNGPKLRWTRGFCGTCGRDVGHFRPLLRCPQCGKSFRASQALEPTGLDYAVGMAMGLVTSGRFVPYRIFERIVWRLRSMRPRRAEEIWLALALGVELAAAVVLFYIYPVEISTLLGASVATVIVIRLVGVVVLRTRVALYDRRCGNWRHESYTRTFLFLLAHFLELTICTAAVLLMIWYSRGCWSPLGTAIVSAWGALLGEQNFFSCPAADYEASLVFLLEKTIAVVLVTVGLSTLIGMLGSVKEAGSGDS